MPCYDHRSTYEYGRAEAQQEIDKLARWLCGILTALEQLPVDFVLSDKELAEWWEEHKAWDKARKEAEE